MEKNVVLFFPSTQKVTSAFDGLSEKMSLRENQMLSEISQESVNIYMVRNPDNFFGENKFLPEFQLLRNIWGTYAGNEPVFGDLVYGFRMPKGVTHTFPSKISEITKNKLIIEKLFPEYALKSILCENYEEIRENFFSISTERKVLKPLEGSLGNGIIIGTTLPEKEELKQENFPYLLQDFFDTSGGFYGLCKSYHDFRIVILNGKIIAKILRTPQVGKYISNTAQGGTLKDLHDFLVPENIHKLVKTIDTYCKKYEHRYYAIDIGLGTDGKLKIFELNGAPGFANEYMARSFGYYTAKNILNLDTFPLDSIHN